MTNNQPNFVDAQRVVQWVLERRSAKAFDPNVPLSAEQIDAIATILRYAPSSTNAQPWHFMLVSTPEGRQRLAQAAAPLDGDYSYNHAKLHNAALAVVLASRRSIDDAYLETLLASDECNGRFAKPEAKAAQQATRLFYVNAHRHNQQALQHWIDKQTYLALGWLLLASHAMGLASCPLEGFDQQALNAEFALPEKGLGSCVLVAVGKRSSDDFNATIPKSRLSEDVVISHW